MYQFLIRAVGPQVSHEGFQSPNCIVIVIYITLFCSFSYNKVLIWNLHRALAGISF